jgi:4-amino-4-deoxy-L-arabinose transferase-like glycosyltransferase
LHPSTLAKRLFIFLSLAIFVFYFYGLGQLPLLGPDEPRYAQVAREMYLRGDLITPTLGGHPWFEKPALLYWLMIGAYKLFGVSEWSARLGPALCGLLTIGAIYSVARTAERNTRDHELNGYGFWSALIAASTLGLVVFSRAASFDIVVTMTASWAIAFFLMSEVSSSRSARLQLAGFYIFVGLSLLAKGLVGIVVPFGVVGTYYVLRRRFPERNKWASLTWGIPLALLVSSIWYGPVIAKHGRTFIQEFFIEHHFARFVSNKYHHPQPLYFYPAILLLLSVPWTMFLVEALANVRNWIWRDDSNMTKVRLCCFAWLLWPIVFFSLSGSKLPGYILPVIPAAILLTSERLTRANFLSRFAHWPFRATGVVCLGLAIAGFVYTHKTGSISLACTLSATIPLALAGALSIGLPNARLASVLSVTAATIILSLVALNCAASVLTRKESTRDLIRLADSRGYEKLPVVAQRGDDRSAEFYASGRVIYRPDGEPLPIDEITTAEAKRYGTLVVMGSSEYLDYFIQNYGMELIGQNGKTAIFLWNP